MTHKHLDNITHHQTPQQQKLMKLSTYITVSGVSIIIIAKLFGWFMTESVTILASLIDSLLDVCVSIMNLLTIHYAVQPPDHEHRFGHGKAEDLAVFSQATFFGVSGIFLIFASIQRFFNPNDQLIHASSEAVGILIFSTLVTLIIIAFQLYVIKRVKSNVIEADSMHYLTDFMTNVAAMIGIIIATHWHIYFFDSLTAIAIAIYIIMNALRMFKRAFNNLMDHELAEQDRQIIISIIRAHREVLSFHDLKTRYAGVKPFIQFHLELEKDMTLKQAHIIASDIEKQILEKFPNAEILVHQDPSETEEDIAYKD